MIARSFFKCTFFCIFLLSAAIHLKAQSNVIHNLLFNSYDNIVKLDFTSGTPVTSYMNNVGYEAIAHAEDASGNLIFYVISSGVYNATGALMPGSGSMFTNSSAAEINICPFPQDPNKYYVFYQSEVCNPLYYTVVNMTLNGGLGGVTNINTLVDPNPVSEGLEVVRRGCMHSYWLLAYQCNVGVTRYLIDSSGVGPPNVIYNYPGPSGYDGRSELDYLNGKAGIAFGFSSPNEALCWNFDCISGTFSNPVVITSSTGSNGFYGLEFSPDTTKVYLTTWYEDITNNFFQYDFATGNMNSYHLTSPPGPNASSGENGPGQIELGPDGKLYVIMNGGTNINIVDNPNSLTPTFSVIVTTSSLALGSSDHIQGDVLNVTSLISDTVCFGDTSSVSVQTTFCGGGIVSWTFADPASGANNYAAGFSAQHLFSAPGIYNVEIIKLDTIAFVTDTFHLNVLVLAPPVVSLGSDTVLCLGQSIVLNAGNPGAAYAWSTASTAQTIQPAQSGTYSVEVDDGNCIATDTIQVQFFGMSPVNLGHDTIICQGDQLTLDAGVPGVNYQWNTGETTQAIQAASTGVYWVIASLAVCSDTDFVRLTVKPFPVVNIGNDTTICFGQLINLNAGNWGATYAWSTGSTSQMIHPLASGTYFVRVSNGPCPASDTMNLTITGPDPVNIGNDTVLCIGASIVLDAGIPNAQYQWSTGEHTRYIFVSNPGTYSVTVEVQNCPNADFINIQRDPGPDVNLGNDTDMCYGHPFMLDAGNPGSYYLWNDGDINQRKFILEEGKYFVEVTDQYTCKNSDTISLGAINCDITLFVPNAFTPGRAINNMFTPLAINVDGYEMLIFNRWGELVFQTNDLSKGWDGKTKGIDCEQAVYIFRINYFGYKRNNEKVSETKYGSVTLIR